jgi:hypothetical protein
MGIVIEIPVEIDPLTTLKWRFSTVVIWIFLVNILGPASSQGGTITIGDAGVRVAACGQSTMKSGPTAGLDISCDNSIPGVLDSTETASAGLLGPFASARGLVTSFTGQEEAAGGQAQAAYVGLVQALRPIPAGPFVPLTFNAALDARGLGDPWQSEAFLDGGIPCFGSLVACGETFYSGSFVRPARTANVQSPARWPRLNSRSLARDWPRLDSRSL